MERARRRRYSMRLSQEPAEKRTRSSKSNEKTLFRSSLKLQQQSQSLSSRKVEATDLEAGSIIWAVNKLEQWGITRGGKYTGKIMTLTLKPTEISRYVALQESIAKLIPEELDRPTIDLTIEVPGGSATRTFGIIGGVGPVSDAHMTEKMLSELQEKGVRLSEVKVQVYSSPPPRTLTEKSIRGLAYLNGVREFVKRGHDHLVLASNTAHCHIDSFESGKVLDSGGRMVNCVTKIAKSIHEEKPSSVLVLGTSQAYEKELYPKEFHSLGVPAIVPNNSYQTQIQNLIEQVKKSPGSCIQDADEIFRIVVENYLLACRQYTAPSHILLSCTELPLGLGPERIAQLEEMLKVKVVDTEVELSKQFSELLAAPKPTS
ncbi:aspartate/glutamate racemase family protein [Sansalvadorimonas sp. 2012CJ34-2]|uniref:Aspartate/glutamate racemase family protein n=1 Tax=Parendozoicomonas callyspongiae TaxID=2942213 RepID=A0ABT0PL15_9GAMM|nr:aspartate/glutamate racemase family protein [Sansalvadorimonas sp. 2012CJ34-2]MCL6272079.1 aspartate/glutamate racemase family protein [Sansalvadorimonas sp. 2012CJ34-2]